MEYFLTFNLCCSHSGVFTRNSTITSHSCAHQVNCSIFTKDSDLNLHMNIPLAARFRAIITGPLNGVPNASDCRQESYGGPRLHDSAGTKRKKDQDDVGPSNPKVLRRAVEAGTSTREVRRTLLSLPCSASHLFVLYSQRYHTGVKRNC